MNEFYNRFDKYDFHNEVDNLHDVLQQDLDPYELSVSEQEVCRQFKKLNTSKAAGPDGISAKVLQSCSGQLSRIFTFIFNLSFSTQSIPQLWKCSCIIPIPKHSSVTCISGQ